MSNPPELHCDPFREDRWKDHTGIYVRARSLRDGWGSFDIAQLTEDSLLAWLNSGPDKATGTVLALLRHGEYGR